MTIMHPSIPVLVSTGSRQLSSPRLRGNRGGWWHSLDGFETEDFSRREDTLRLESAQLVTCGAFYCDDPECAPSIFPCFDEAQASALIASLEAGASNPLERSLASSVCMREFRMDVLQAVFDAFEKYPNVELATTTAIKRSWSMTPEQLLSMPASRIKNQFFTDLKRTGITAIAGPFVAFLHGEYEPTARIFVLHWHVVTTVEKARALHRLKKLRGYVTTHTGAAPIVVKPVKDRVKQFSYLLKAFWPQKSVRDGVRERDPHRIDEPYHTLYLVWLDQQSLKDITVMNGVWSLRKGGTELMKQLYFKVFGRSRTSVSKPTRKGSDRDCVAV